MADIKRQQIDQMLAMIGGRRCMPIVHFDDYVFYIKFASADGIDDETNGQKLRLYLDSNGVTYKSLHICSLSMDTAEFMRLFG